MSFKNFFIWFYSEEEQFEFETLKTCESEEKFSELYLQTQFDQIFSVVSKLKINRICRIMVSVVKFLNKI